MRRVHRITAWALAVAALALVFLAYRSPQLMVDLASQLWACF